MTEELHPYNPETLGILYVQAESPEQDMKYAVEKFQKAFDGDKHAFFITETTKRWEDDEYGGHYMVFTLCSDCGDWGGKNEELMPDFLNTPLSALRTFIEAYKTVNPVEKRKLEIDIYPYEVEFYSYI